MGCGETVATVARRLVLCLVHASSSDFVTLADVDESTLHTVQHSTALYKPQDGGAIGKSDTPVQPSRRWLPVAFPRGKTRPFQLNPLSSHVRLPTHAVRCTGNCVQVHRTWRRRERGDPSSFAIESAKDYCNSAFLDRTARGKPPRSSRGGCFDH
jgi:hypothetical protein